MLVQQHYMCPSTDAWTKKMWYVHTMRYYSTFKKKESLPLMKDAGILLATTSKDCDSISLSKVQFKQIF